MLLHLLEAALRSFALGAAVWLGLRFMRLHNPQTRMTAWTVVLMASLSMPVLMHWATVSVPIHSPTISDAAIAPASLATPSPAPPTALAPEKKMSLPPAPDNAGAAARFPGSYGAARRAAIAAIDWQAFAIGLYLAVVGGLLLRLVIGLAITGRLLRSGQRLDADWTAGSDVRLSATVATPVTFGSTILLPAECLDWSPMKRQAVLAHERSHVARGDFHVMLLATLHRAVFWFSPFSWWLLNELAETAEIVSDDAAIETLGDRSCYAEILLDVAQSARPIGAGIAMARTRSALKRVDHILAASVPPSPRSGWGKWALIVAGLAPLVAIATVSFSSSLPNETKLVTFSASAGQPGNQSPGNRSAAKSTAAVPELWISRIASTGPQADSADIFNPDADWKAVAGHTGAVQFPPGVILSGKDDNLQRAFHNLAERHIALAVEFRVLVRSDQCPQMTKGYSDPGDLEKILERIARLGGDLKYVVMDDPYFFGHRFSGPGACLEPPAKLARQVAEKIQLVRTYFPKAQIGTADVVDESSPWIDEMVEWTDVYQRVTGEPLAFFHADVAWSHAAVRNLLPLARALKARHIPFGIIYNADDAAHSDETWIDSTRQHIAEVESTLGIHPQAAIFRSWAPYPSHLLPETQPGTLTNLAAQYLLARPSITLTRETNLLSGGMVDAQGHPVAWASLTVEALDVAGSMDLVERHLTAKVPSNAATAMVAIQANMGGACVCAGRVDASIGTIRYHEASTDRHEEIPPFPDSPGNAAPPVRVMQFPPGQPVNLIFKSFPVTPGADYELDVPLSVSANGERAGYAALTFLDGAGKGIRLDRVWFRPSVRSLGNAVTNADGRFQLELPPAVTEAGSEIRVYFPGSASLGSQTATHSQQGQF
jgi:beta-lactamase regulating signal transducer with metallopeptidase domain